MKYIRNVLVFSVFALLVAACGGGDTVTTAGGANASAPTNPVSTPGTGDSTGSTGTGSTGTGSTGTGSTGTGSSGSGSTVTTSTVTLKWSAPTTRLDNSPASLSDISGYRLYYGTSATNTPTTINISSGTTSQYTITLPTGTYYFRISALDSSGYEGALSSALQKTF